jgi:hypothetical protein
VVLRREGERERGIAVVCLCLREYVQDRVHRANFVQEGKKKNSLVQNSTSRRNLRERERERERET